MKKLNKGKKKKTTYSPIYQRMYDAIGNEEIFWEWFWETLMFWETLGFISLEATESDSSASRILGCSFHWSESKSGEKFWVSLFEALRKAGK